MINKHLTASYRAVCLSSLSLEYFDVLEGGLRPLATVLLFGVLNFPQMLKKVKANFEEYLEIRLNLSRTQASLITHLVVLRLPVGHGHAQVAGVLPPQRVEVPLGLGALQPLPLNVEHVTGLLILRRLAHLKEFCPIDILLQVG